MAGETILFFVGVIEEARPRPGIMRGVAVFAAIGGNGGFRGVRPGIIAGAVPWLVGQMMRGLLPESWLVTLEAKHGAGIILDKEFAVLIVVRIMAGGALKLMIVIEANFLGQRGGILELAVRGDEGVVISEGDWVVVGEVRAQIAWARRHGGDVIAHRDRRGAAGHHAERDGPVVTREAEFGGAGRLADSRFRRGTAVGSVGG